MSETLKLPPGWNDVRLNLWFSEHVALLAMLQLRNHGVVWTTGDQAQSVYIIRKALEFGIPKPTDTQVIDAFLARPAWGGRDPELATRIAQMLPLGIAEAWALVEQRPA